MSVWLNPTINIPSPHVSGGFRIWRGEVLQEVWASDVQNQDFLSRPRSRPRPLSLKQWLPNGKLLLLSLTKCHGVPYSLPSRITTKVLKTCKIFSPRPRPRPRPNVQDQAQDFMIQDIGKSKTFIVVLEAPRDQDPGLEE